MDNRAQNYQWRSTSQKEFHFISGFIGWFLVNGLLWSLIGSGGGAFIVNLFILPINIGVLIILAAIHKTRWIVWGILAAWAVNFIFAIILGVIWNGACLVPFFSQIGL